MGMGTVYLDSVKATLAFWKEKGDRAISQLNHDELHWAANSESNSVAIIVKHMVGNMFSRWADFLTTDGEKPNRNRDQEFGGGYPSKDALIAAWEGGWLHLFLTLDDLNEEDLLKTIYIRGEPFPALLAIQKEVAHYANHIGQILYVGKQIKGENWTCLSIPRGKSQEFLEEKISKSPAVQMKN